MDESPHPHEEQIIRSWNANAKPWSRAIQTGSIQSRTLVTDRAIIEAVSSMAPRRVLDVGCGEGWLARALSARAMTVTGVDAVPELIVQAAALGGGEFYVLEYRALAHRQWRGGPFDAAVCNFSLLGGAYHDGWRAGNWSGFSADFTDPAPWYFRTLESWFSMLRRSGFEVLQCREPTAPGAAAPASVILICKARIREHTATVV